MKQYRQFTIKQLTTRALEDGSELVRIAISTDTPILRTGIEGHRVVYEVLGHNPEEVDLSYFADDGAPFCVEHALWDQVGVLENHALEDGTLRADVRFSNSVRGQEFLDDMKRGIRKRISVGYEVFKYDSTGVAEDGTPIVRATQWRPYEASVVSVPADMAAGVGRHRHAIRSTSSVDSPLLVFDDNNNIEQVILSNGIEITDPFEVEEYMKRNGLKTTGVLNRSNPLATAIEELVTDIVVDLQNAADLEDDDQDPTTDEVPSVDESPVEQEEVVEPVTEEGDDEEVREDDEDVVVEDVDTEEDSTEETVADERQLHINTTRTAPQAVHMETPQMSDKKNGSNGAKERISELTTLATRYEMTDKLADWITSERSIDSIKADILETRSTTNVPGAPAVHTTKRDNTFAGAVRSFLKGDNSELAERGVDQARESGQSVNSSVLYLPTNVQMIPMSAVRRMFGARNSIAGSGVNATGKAYLSFEETLREGALLSRVGGEILSVNDLPTMPYFSAAATASMAAETGSVSATNVQVGTVTWSPERIAGRYQFSNLLGKLNGTYDFEAELNVDLLAETVRKFDQQVWGGTGTNNITGLYYDTAITNHGTSGSFSIGSGSAIIAAVAKRNGNVDNGSWVVSHDVNAYMASTAFANGGATVLSTLKADHPVFATNYLPVGINNSNAAFFGDFSKVTAITVGALEVKRDDLTALADGKTILHMEMYADCQVRQPDAIQKWNYVIV